MVKSCCIGDGHPTFNRNPYNGYINPYYWVDDHPLLYGNNGSLDPGTSEYSQGQCQQSTISHLVCFLYVFLRDSELPKNHATNFQRST